MLQSISFNKLIIFIDTTIWGYNLGIKYLEQAQK